jgi:hypothetical protein
MQAGLGLGHGIGRCELQLLSRTRHPAFDSPGQIHIEGVVDQIPPANKTTMNTYRISRPPDPDFMKYFYNRTERKNKDHEAKTANQEKCERSDFNHVERPTADIGVAFRPPFCSVFSVQYSARVSQTQAHAMLTGPGMPISWQSNCEPRHGQSLILFNVSPDSVCRYFKKPCIIRLTAAS